MIRPLALSSAAMLPPWLSISPTQLNTFVKRWGVEKLADEKGHPKHYRPKWNLVGGQNWTLVIMARDFLIGHPVLPFQFPKLSPFLGIMTWPPPTPMLLNESLFWARLLMGRMQDHCRMTHANRHEEAFSGLFQCSRTFCTCHLFISCGTTFRNGAPQATEGRQPILLAWQAGNEMSI